MKKIIQSLLTITMLFAISFVQAQNFTVEGHLLSTPQQSFPIYIEYMPDSTTVVFDTIYTDNTTGYFTGAYSLTATTMGLVVVSYTDCNNNLESVDNYFFPMTTVDFGNMQFCPVVGPYDAFFEVLFSGVTVPVNFELSWDDGITFTAYSTDSAGNYLDTLLNAPTSGNAIIRYTDCYNTVITQNQLFDQSNPFVSFNEVYCNVATNNLIIIMLHNNGLSIPLNISMDGGVTFTTEYTDTSGFYGNLIVTASSVIVSFTDCNGTVITDTIIPNPFALITQLDYCPVVCEANFDLQQEVIFDTANFNILFTGNVMIVDHSIGTNLTYTWNFGDGSPTYSGVNFTHSYATSGLYNLCLSIDNGTGCVDTFCETLDIDSNGVLSGKTNGGFVLQMGNGDNETEGVTAINNLQKDVKITVYPNPATSYVNISLNSKINENAVFEIYDLTGKLIQSNNLSISKGNQVVNIELNELSKGMYITQLKTNEGTLSTKLTIK